jgi:hypothetical protein
MSAQLIIPDCQVLLYYNTMLTPIYHWCGNIKINLLVSNGLVTRARTKPMSSKSMTDIPKESSRGELRAKAGLNRSDKLIFHDIFTPWLKECLGKSKINDCPAR